MAQNPILDQWGAGYAYAHQGTYTLTAASTISVKGSAGILHYISINQKGGNSGAGLTVYDNTTGSGTVIGVIDSSVQVTTMFYDVAAATGITIVTSTTTTGIGPDITVSYQ